MNTAINITAFQKGKKVHSLWKSQMEKHADETGFLPSDIWFWHFTNI